MKSLIVTIFACLIGMMITSPIPDTTDPQSGDRLEQLNEEFQLHKINSTSGLYFDELSSLQLYHTEWSFVTYVNLSYFTTEAAHLEKTVESIQRLCDIIEEDFELQIPTEYCAHTMAQLQNLIEEMNEFSAKWFLHQELESNAFHGSRRRKRGFFGAISKRLFFSMSDDDAEFYRNQINTLRAENMDHMLYAKNQTSLFQETLKVLNNTVQSQIIQHTALQKQFEDIEHLLTNSTVSSTLTSKLNGLMHYTMFLITGFREKQRNLFDSITSNSKSFEIIPPKMFMKELDRVKSIIAAQGLHLPLPLKPENLSKFYQITTTEGRLIDNNLVLRFTIPLIESKTFILYKALSLPQRNGTNGTNETFEYIVPHNEYIAHNSIDETFVTLTDDELRNCHRIDKKNIVCKQTFPVISATNHMGCEINSIRRQNITSECDIRRTNLTGEIWTKLQLPNTYLFTIPTPQVAVIGCPNSRTKLSIQDTGVISLAPKCRIKTERIEIVALQTIERKIVKNLKPSVKVNVNVAAEVDRAKQIKSLSNPQLPSHLSAEEIRKLKEIHDNVDSLRAHTISYASLNLFHTNPENNISLISVIVAILVILVGIAAVVICFKYCAVPGCHILLFLIFVALVVSGIILII